MTTGMRRAWRHVKYTNSDLRAARERAEENNAQVLRYQEMDREAEERLGGVRHRHPRFYGSDTIVDPDLAEPSHTRIQDGDYGWKLRYIFGTVIVIALSLIFALGFGIRALTHNIDHRECPRKGIALGLQSQFVDYSFFDWECLANVDGRWVPIDTVNNDTGIYIRGGAGIPSTTTPG